MGLLRQEDWSELPFASPGDIPDPGTEPGFPALQADSSLCEPPEKHVHCQKKKKKFSRQDKIVSAKALWLEEPCIFRYPDTRPVWLKHRLRGT